MKFDLNAETIVVDCAQIRSIFSMPIIYYSNRIFFKNLIFDFFQVDSAGIKHKCLNRTAGDVG